MDYRERIVDKQISRYLKLFGGVLLEGPKWCGKTWAARNASESEFDVADPEGNFRNRETALLNPSVVLEGPRPHLIDEWHEVPTLWDAVRYEIDRTGRKSQFILTGSSTPADNQTIHSGTGRIGRIRLETMTMHELGITNPAISLEGLFAENQPFENGKYAGKQTITNLVGVICKGGWPGLIELDINDAAEVVDGYLDNVSKIDIPRIDNVKRDPDKIKSLFRSLARNLATTVKYSTITRDISESEGTSISNETTTGYMKVLKRLFLLRDIPAWEPALKSTVRLRTTPKRIFSDASLAVSALGANVKSLESDLKLFGSLFENQILHDLIVYAGSFGAEVRHYQDNAGLEVDGIVEKRDGSWGGIEIKLGYHQEDKAAMTLLRLKKKMQENNQPPPAFLAVIIGVGGLAKRRDDGVLVVPVDCLCP